MSCFSGFDSYRCVRVSAFVQTFVVIFSVIICLNYKCFAVKSEVQVTSWLFVAVCTCLLCAFEGLAYSVETASFGC